MENIFNTLIDSFVADKVGLAENFLSESLANNLTNHLLALHAGNKLNGAGTGNDKEVSHDTLFRGDKIYWLDRAHGNIYENTFFDLMDQFVQYLNQTCYTGINSYEFHYTLYEKGAFYKRHLDKFRNDDSRKYSMILYLNKDWIADDGGELCIYHGDRCQQITPTHGKTVFFKSSQLEHEVLLTKRPRMSITGWLKS